MAWVVGDKIFKEVWKIGEKSDVYLEWFKASSSARPVMVSLRRLLSSE